MISYIFKSKTKNILAIIFTVLCVLNGNLIYKIYTYAIQQVFPFRAILGLLPYILILIYLSTLKREYKFKEWLFPAAFLIFAGLHAYSAIISVITNIRILDSLQTVMWFVWSVAYGLTVLAAYILCFVGAIKNFKNVIFLRSGMIMLMIVMLLSQFVDFGFVGGFEYFANIPQEYLMSAYSSMFKAIIKILVGLLFYFGIFNLTLNKKSEYIDITPYVEERKAKKTAKLEAKQQEEARLNEPVLEAQDGSWRCMACGKILPDSTQRCECGYKK